MAITRLDNIGIVVDDLDTMIAFFTDLGMELEGRTTVEGPWVDQTLGLSGVKSEIAMMRTPDGHGRIELSKYWQPSAIVAEPPAPNTLGLHRVMLAVDDIDASLERIRRYGAEPLDTVGRYRDAYRLCYVRAPEGLLIALAQEL